MSINKVENRSMRQVSIKIHGLQYKITHLGLNPNVLTVGVDGTTAKIADYDGRLVIKETAVTNARNAMLDNEVLLDPAIANLHLYVSDYFSNIQRGTKRGYFALSDRTTVGLNLHDDQYPPMITNADVLAAGKKIIDKDGLRIDAIAKPMALPSFAEIETVYNTALGISGDNDNLTITLNEANGDLMSILPEGILLCNKADNEIETHFDNGDKPAMRNNSIHWFIVYHSSTPIAFLKLTSLLTGTNAPLEHINYLADPGEEKGESDIQGFDSMNIHHFGTIIINYTSTLYNNGSITVTIAENETIIQTIFLTART